MVFFADRIYQLRNEKGYTREELAAELGCMPRHHYGGSGGLL